MGARQEKEVSLSERGPRRETSLPLFHAPRFVPTLFPLRELAPAVTYFAFNLLQTLLTRSLSHLSTSSPPHSLLFFKNPPSLALVFEISLDSRESAREGKNIYWDYFTFRQRERGNVSWRIYILRFLRLELYISPEKEGIIIRSDIFEFVSSSIPRKGGKKIVSLLIDLFDLYSKRNRLEDRSFLDSMKDKSLSQVWFLSLITDVKIRISRIPSPSKGYHSQRNSSSLEEAALQSG